MTLQSIGFKFFAKIMKGSYVFCCSSCISFNPTSHLNLQFANYHRFPYIFCHQSTLTNISRGYVQYKEYSRFN